MKNKNLIWLVSLFILAVSGLTVVSCNKKFDEPPAFKEPDIKSNTTISDLKATHTSGAFEPITADKIIEGVVVADDKSGNFYKSIVIQDASGGITVRLDGTNLFTTYPVGKKIFIKLNGLFLGDYNGLVQLGGGVDETDPSRPSLAPLASNLFDTYIVQGSTGNVVTPKVVDVSQLTTSMLDPLQSTLIQLNNFEFLAADTGKLFAPPQQTVNFTIRNCDGKTIVLRNSGYANFAGFSLPDGNGSIVAIYSVFGSTPQLFIRDTSDIKFNGTRCNGGGTGNLTIKSIQEIKALVGGAPIPAGTGIEGVVVSDTKNEAAGNYRIQDSANYGIQVRFTSSGNSNFKLNDKLQVDVSGLSVSLFNGDIQINNVAGATVLGTGAVVPRLATAAQIAANKDLWASTVVTLSNVSITAGTPGTSGTNYTFTDASGSIVSFVRATLGYTPPASASSITGYVSLFNGTPQLTLRSSADVVGGGTPPPPGGAMDLTTSPLLLNFDNIGSGLPTGVFVYTGATTTTAGSAGAFNTAADVWFHYTSGFKNFASATGLTASSDSMAQVNAADRALGVRQTSSSDKGVAFVFQISNTTGKSNLKLNFQLQSLDNTSPRVSTWTVDYGTGDAPSSFTAATATGTLTTGGNTFSNNAISVDFGSALNNISERVWVRVVVLDATTGTGNRTSTAIDNAQFSWN